MRHKPYIYNRYVVLCYVVLQNKTLKHNIYHSVSLMCYNYEYKGFLKLALRVHLDSTCTVLLDKHILNFC